MTAADTAHVVIARIDDALWAANLRPYGDGRRLAVSYDFLLDTAHLESETAKQMIEGIFAGEGNDASREELKDARRPRALFMPDDDDDLRMVGD